MCPGFNYDLTFSMGYVKINGQLVSSLADCDVRWLTGKPDTWSDDDGFQSSPSYPIGASNRHTPCLVPRHSMLLRARLVSPRPETTTTLT